MATSSRQSHRSERHFLIDPDLLLGEIARNDELSGCATR